MAGLENADPPQDVLYVHQALLDEQCRPICDELREYWKVFDFETVQRFALYLYDADYSYSAPAAVEVTARQAAASKDPNHCWNPFLSMSPPPGANGANSATSGAGGLGAGGPSNPSTLLDAAGTSTASENAPGTVIQLRQLLREPAPGAPTTAAGATGGPLGIASSVTTGASEDTAKTGTESASNTSSTSGEGVSETTKSVSGASTMAGWATGGLLGTNPEAIGGLFGTGNSGTTGGLFEPGRSAGKKKKRRPYRTGISGGTGGTLGAASPGTTGLLGTANSRSSWATVIGTICPRPMFVPCKLEEGEDSQNIACMPEYRDWSPEELRVQDYLVLGKLYSTIPSKIPTGQNSPPVRPLTPLKGFEIENLHRVSETEPPERLEHPAGYDFETVLLAHARLYILSRSQGINALSDLCISRLWQELLELSVPEIEPQISRNAISLLRYAYCCPREMATPEALQPAWRQLQGLASQFCALNIHVMGVEPKFRALLQEAGTLATDIMDKTLRRLMSAESGPSSWNHPAHPVWGETQATN